MASPFRSGWSYPHADPSIVLFGRAVEHLGLDLPPGARVLELGCCENDFSHWLLKADPSIQLTGVDVNVPQDYAGTFVQGQAESQVLADDSFEAVLCLGSFEHFGLGYYGDPVEPTAQETVARKIGRWLVPGGVWYYDVPWTPWQGSVTENRHFRVFDDADLRDLDAMAGVRPVKRLYAHGQTDAIQWTRPASPTTPFWYVQRLVEKPS